MATSTLTSERTQNSIVGWLKSNLALLVVVAILGALPFIIALVNGDSIGDVLINESGNSKFIQGLLIEVFILAVFAISYDLVLGITGLLSFGHAMFFAVGAYLTGILLKTFEWTLLPTIVAVIVAGIVQAVLFSIVLPRVKGITFALVTLGMASVFDIIIGTRELAPYTGADVGLQGIPRPALLDPVARLRFYFIALAFTVLVYLLYRRFVDSPTGRVCIAIRENEGRARMLGFNTFYFKLAALTVASITAALAGLLNALYTPIVSPEIATMAYTVDALLMILIGGMGTLSGAMIGAALFRLLDYYLFKWFGEVAGFLLGAIYVTFVLFVPYGIVGTWRLRRLDWRRSWQIWRKRLGLGGGDET
ncbi:MAG: branched-chain amino acid ABC transporter permease [Anaerolineae bacterium]|jgi:branched-chain amino acid transport system permease protein